VPRSFTIVTGQPASARKEAARARAERLRLPRSALKRIARYGIRPALSPRVPLAVQRGVPEAAARATFLPPGTRVTATQLGGVPAERVEHRDADQSRAVLYLHGGGYVLGSAVSHRPVAAHISRAARAPVYNLDYRLAPEHPFPGAPDDALAAYLALIGIVGDAWAITVAGDSAGGGLALALALRLRERELPRPAALGLICPWTDLTLSGESVVTNAPRDALLRVDWARWAADLYRGGHDPRLPELSPNEADLSGFPPIVLHGAADDTIVSDADRLAERARAAGVQVDYTRFDGLWHDFHLHVGLLADADDALERLGRGLRDRLEASAAPAPSGRA
jgi:epsilon-lactone hydrolase